MAAPLTWSIVRVVQTSTPDPDTGRMLPQRRITYMVGKHGPFDLVVSEADFTGPKVKQLLDEQAMHFNQLIPPAAG